MDYCEAGSLSELYEDLDSPFSEPQIVYMCNRVLEVCRAVHEGKLNFRD